MKEDSTAVVLFTGGADGGLAAILVLEKHKDIVLLTFKNGYELFANRSCLLAARLQARYKPQRVGHKIINNKHIFNLIFKERFTFKKYLNNLGLLCLAERVAIYIHTVIFCLENRIQYVYDGNNGYQGKIAFPQSPEVLLIVKSFFGYYGIFYDSPIYKYENLSEDALLKYGVIKKNELYQKRRLFFKKNSFFVFDIIFGLWHKLRNKLHPVFFIATGLQLVGRLVRLMNYSEKIEQRKISERIGYLNEKFEFGKGYIAAILKKS